MIRPKKILAPTDLSKVSMCGMRQALEIARDSSAEVIVYHVVDFSADRHAVKTGYAGKRHPLENRRHLLDKFLSENFADCIDLVEVRQVVEFGAPYRSIVNKAASEGVDMIVMSSSGRTGIDHFMLGSTAEKVVARASCPVLVIPRPGRREGAAKAA